MSSPIPRRVVTATLVSGLTALALAAPGPASAALAGANPSAFTNRPNLQTVTFNGKTASFVFDQPVNLVNAAGFTIGGYQAGQNLTQTPSQVFAGSGTAANTINVTYGSTPDFDNATYGTVAAGAVTGNGTFGNGNFQDSTAIAGAAGQSGTAGHSSVPDLSAIRIDTDANRIVYTFDQKISSTAPPASAFSFTDGNGTQHVGAAGGGTQGDVLVSDFEASVPFAGSDVREAVTGNVNGGAVVGKSTGASANFPSAQATPGTSGTSAAPRLVSAALIAGTGQIDFKFDRPVTAPTPGLFLSGLANGQMTTASAATVIGDGTVVRATFGVNLDRVEQLVYASVNAGAARSSGSNIATPVGGAPVGGNAGAKATGYTTAPDAQRVTFNNSTGEVDVTFDSRIIAGGVNPASYTLVNAVGTPIGTAAPSTIAFDQSSTPQPTTVRVQFAPDQVKAATTLVLASGAATNSLPGAGASSIVQALSPGASGRTFAKFDASKASTTLRPASTQIAASSALARAYRPTTNTAQAVRNARIIVRAISSPRSRTKLAPVIKAQRSAVHKAAR